MGEIAWFSQKVSLIYQLVQPPNGQSDIKNPYFKANDMKLRMKEMGITRREHSALKSSTKTQISVRYLSNPLCFAIKLQ